MNTKLATGNSCVPHHFPDLHKENPVAQGSLYTKYGCHLWNHSYEGHFCSEGDLLPDAPHNFSDRPGIWPFPDGAD